MNNVKTFLTILFVIILSARTYSQQKDNSKILSILSKKLNDNSLYYESMDTIIKKFKDNIIAREQNIDLTLDKRRDFKFNDRQHKFEDVIVVKAPNIKLLNYYSPDTIYFYFNNQKLNKCTWHFTLNKQNVEILTKGLEKQIGPSGYMGYMEWGGPYWADQDMQLNFFYNDRIDQNLLLEFEFLPKKELIVLPKSKNEILESQIKIDRHGKGNNTFNLSISKLESIINSHTTLKMLETQLGAWNSDGYENNVSFEYNENTKDFTTPLFEVSYNISIKNQNTSLKAEIKGGLNNPIRLLKITVDFTGMQLAEFKESLHAHGYLLNENLTALYNKLDISSTGYLSYEKRNRKMVISIKYLSNGSYTIVIS